MGRWGRWRSFNTIILCNKCR